MRNVMAKDLPSHFHIIEGLTAESIEHGPSPAVYKARQRCKQEGCKNILSIYNPFDVCNSCRNKKCNEVLRETGCASVFTATSISLKMLNAKMRKPVRDASRRRILRNVKTEGEDHFRD